MAPPLAPPPGRSPLAAACSGWPAAGGAGSRRRARTASSPLAPLVSVLLFLAAIISAFWYLRNEEFERETESVKRDIEITQQQIGLRLIQNQEQLVRLAGELARAPVDTGELRSRWPRPSRASGPRSRTWPGSTRSAGRVAPCTGRCCTTPACRRTSAADAASRRSTARPTPAPKPPSAPRAAALQPVYSTVFERRHRRAGLPAAGAAGRTRRLRRRPGRRVLGRRAAAPLRAARRSRRATASASSTDRPAAAGQHRHADARARPPRPDRHRARRCRWRRRSTACCCAARATAPRSA